MNNIFKNTIWVCATCIILCGCKETNAEQSNSMESLGSLPFLVVDLDGDGIETIPLEKSHVYFDIDGDGLAERTQWISPDDGLLSIFSREEDRNLNSIYDRLMAMFTNGLLEATDYDKSKDNIYDEADYQQLPRNKTFRELGFSIARDRNMDGLPEAHRDDLVPCDFVSFDIGNNVLSCEEGKTYKVEELKFEYEDSNVKWDVLCEFIKFHGDREEYQTRCRNNGANPNKREE